MLYITLCLMYMKTKLYYDTHGFFLRSFSMFFSTSASLFLINFDYIVLFHLELQKKVKTLIIFLIVAQLSFHTQICNNLVDMVTQSCKIGETIGIGTWNTKQIVDTYLFGCFVVVDPSPIKKESKRWYWNTYSFRVRLLQLSHLSCHLYSKMDFIRVLSNNF